MSVTFSVPTLDEEVWRRTEPGTAPPRQRLRALSRLVDAGVRASVGLAPILPGISDAPEQLAAVVRAAREAGACGVWASPLHLKPGTREHFLDCLARDWPELAARVRAPLRPRRLPRARRRGARPRRACGELARSHGIRDRRRVRLSPPAAPEQLTLLPP